MAARNAVLTATGAAVGVPWRPLVAAAYDGADLRDPVILGDMIAHQIDRIGESLGLRIEVPERDAFILKGGAFNLPS